MTTLSALLQRLSSPALSLTTSTQRLDPLVLSRFYDLLPNSSISTFIDDDAISGEISSPVRSSFQWLFHPSCDVLNFPPPDSDLSIPNCNGLDGNPMLVSRWCRRMWVSGSMTFHTPFYPKELVEKTTKINKIEEKKTQRQGSALFVERQSVMEGDRGGYMTESLTHAYLQNTRYNHNQNKTTTPSPSPSPTPETKIFLLQETVQNIDSILLFKYSALTYNAHRIHYDRDYATKVEGYPDLVVHGPLIASILLDFYQQHLCRSMEQDKWSGYTFSYRGKLPLFVGSDMHVSAWTEGGVEESTDHKQLNSVMMAAKNDDGQIIMEAQVTKRKVHR